MTPDPFTEGLYVYMCDLCDEQRRYRMDPRPLKMLTREELKAKPRCTSHPRKFATAKLQIARPLR